MKAFTECLVQIGLQFYSALIIILAGTAVLLCSWAEFRMTVLKRKITIRS